MISIATMINTRKKAIFPLKIAFFLRAAFHWTTWSPFYMISVESQKKKITPQPPYQPLGWSYRYSKLRKLGWPAKRDSIACTSIAVRYAHIWATCLDPRSRHAPDRIHEPHRIWKRSRWLKKRSIAGWPWPWALFIHRGSYTWQSFLRSTDQFSKRSTTSAWAESARKRPEIKVNPNWAYPHRLQTRSPTQQWC